MGYVSDGAAQHFKQRGNFANLACHFDDYGVDAEWNFNASSHGKGGWDGGGSILKSHARKQISKNPIRCPIRSPRTFYEETKKHFKNMAVFYCDKDQIQKIYGDYNLEDRYTVLQEIFPEREYQVYVSDGAAQHFKCILGQNTHLKVKPVSTLDDSHYETVWIM